MTRTSPTRRFVPGVALAAVLAVLAVPLTRPPAARAESLDSLSTRVATITQTAATAGDQLRTGNRAAAVGTLRSGESLTESLQAAAAASESELGRKRAKFQRLLVRLRRQFQNSIRRTDDAAFQPFAAQRTISRVSSAALAADVFLQRTQALGLTLQEMRARSAGVHEPQRVVLFKIQIGRTPGGDPCSEDPVVNVIDSSGAGAVVETFIERRRDRRGNRVIQVTMGPSGGQARVEVTACGVTRTWLLFNRGERNAYPVLPKPQVARFDGSYSGSWSGRAKIQGAGSNPVSGGVSLSVAGGVMTISDPGSGRGRVAASGRSRFAGGGGVALGARYSFSGSLTESVTGGVSGGGRWSAKFQGGTARGTWSVGRN